jgi:flagellar protein FliO/FliZ
LYLGGEKLKPLLFCHTYRFTFCLLLWAMVLILPGLGAQEAAGEESGAVEAAEAGLPLSPAEQDMLLGESNPGLVIAEPGPVSGFVIFRTVLLLILAAAAVYGVVYVVKRLSQPRDVLNPNLRLLGTLRLGPNRFVHVVALGTRAWLVGAGEGGISHIADVTEQEALDTLFLDESRRNGVSGRAGDFRSLLRRLGVLKPESGESSGEDLGRDDLAENIRRRGDRLRGL